MDLLIRKVKPETIYAIDKMVERLNKNSSMKISRNEFLKNQIEKIPERDLYEKVDGQVAVQLKAMIEFIKEDKDALNQIFKLLVNGEEDVAGNLLDDLGTEDGRGMYRGENKNGK